MQITGTWVVKNFSEAEVPFGVVRIPYKEVPLAHVNINGWAIWKTDPERQQAAWKWLSFILSKENYISQIESEKWIPIRESHKADPEFQAWLETVPQLQYQVNLPTDEFRARTVTLAGSQPYSILWEVVEAALLDQRPLETALDEAAAEVDEVLAEAAE
ncbi:extracellular solute-binding protein [Chloroflexi bacterium TSY]|nr:extracellular solute-binding protein [Chloroflexi bacterium TSY]